MPRPTPSGPVVPADRFDFHSHSYLTDGTTSPTEMWAEARLLGHRVLALTDHLAMEDPAPLLRRLHREARAWEGDRFVPLVGVELTRLPPRKIAPVARAARRAGAEIVIVHGESIVEHVPEGTNRAAVESGSVDILAHPGLLAEDDARRAHEQDVVLELSGRRGHSLTNGHVARTAREAGARVVVDSDAHGPEQLLPTRRARQLAEGAGLQGEEITRALETTPLEILRRLGGR